jgi:hypothetical protein
MTIKIEHRVPPPHGDGDFVRRPSDGLYTMPRKWPWPQMKAGDHITVKNKKEARSAHNSFMCHKRTKHSRLSPTSYVTMRKQPDNTYILWLCDQ